MQQMFAAFEPDAHGHPLAGASVRPATPADIAATGRLAAEREGEDPETWSERQSRRIADPDHRLFVAEVDGQVVGYGWVSHQRPEGEGGRDAPDGWYLSGVVVAPELRRRGIGMALTKARVAWVFERADQVHYVVSAANLASRRLHETLGFVETTDDFCVPGVVFARCDGILCTATRGREAAVIDLAARRSARR